MRKTVLTVLLGGVLVPGMFAASFQGLGDLPGGKVYSWGAAVSWDGKVVVGTSQSSSGYEAFRWTAAAGMVGLGALPGGSFYSSANGISSDGKIIVGSSSSSAGRQAYRWTETTGMVGLGDLPGGNFVSWGTGVSADGSVVVGHSSSTLGPTRGEAFRWTATEGMVGLGKLPGGQASSEVFAVSADGSVIVGASGSADASDGTWEAFRWTAATGMQPLGDFPEDRHNSVAYGVSPEGLVIVGRGHSGVEDPFRWTAESGLQHLGFLPCDTWSTSFAASANGAVIVGDPNQGTGDCAFIWDAQHRMRNLHQVLGEDYGLDLTGWQLSAARAITPDGNTIVGYGRNPAGQTEGWIATGLASIYTLNVTASGPGVEISWPTNTTGFALQSCTTLVNESWCDCATPPTVVGTNFQVVIPNASGAAYFRLKK